MTYYCRLEPDEGQIAVRFPDLPNVITYGSDREEALLNAGEALNGVLEAELSTGVLPEEARTKAGEGLLAVAVEPHIAVAYQLRKVRGKESQAEPSKSVLS